MWVLHVPARRTLPHNATTLSLPRTLGEYLSLVRLISPMREVQGQCHPSHKRVSMATAWFCPCLQAPGGHSTRVETHIVSCLWTICRTKLKDVGGTENA